MNSSAPFWRRFANSAVLIAFGVIAHVWLVPHTDVDIPDLRFAAVPEPPPAFATTPAPGAVDTDALARAAGDPVTAGAIPANVDGLPTKDSRSTPDTTYPAPERIVGTSGEVRPALLVEPAATAITGSQGDTQRDEPAAEPRASAPAAGGAGADHPTVHHPELETIADLPADAGASAGGAVAGSTDDREVAPSLPARPEGDQEQEEALVYHAVQEYRSAYERLDAAAAKTVWPTVDARALRDAFDQLAEQRLRFDSCGVTISGDSASARCRGQAEYLPKVGGRRALVKTGEWVFDLSRRDTAWQIVSARIR